MIRRVGHVVFGADRQVAAWVAKQIPWFSPGGEKRALGVIKGGDIVAGVVFERFNGLHMEASIAAEPGSGWADRATLRTLFAYPFIQCGCEAISVVVASSNLASLNLATKLGFEAEAIIRFAAHDGSSLVVMKMFRETCRWIQGHGQGKQRTGPAGPAGDSGGGGAI